MRYKYFKENIDYINWFNKNKNKILVKELNLLNNKKIRVVYSIL